jgi:hypothetical protein
VQKRERARAKQIGGTVRIKYTALIVVLILSLSGTDHASANFMKHAEWIGANTCGSMDRNIDRLAPEDRGYTFGLMKDSCREFKAPPSFPLNCFVSSGVSPKKCRLH